MAVSKCPGCGADLTNDQKECPYCGAKNPNYVAPKPVVQPTFTYSSGPKPAPVAGSSINWLVFIILLLIFWPAAIIYLVLKK